MSLNHMAAVLTVFSIQNTDFHAECLQYSIHVHKLQIFRRVVSNSLIFKYLSNLPSLDIILVIWRWWERFIWLVPVTLHILFISSLKTVRILYNYRITIISLVVSTLPGASVFARGSIYYSYLLSPRISKVATFRRPACSFSYTCRASEWASSDPTS